VAAGPVVEQLSQEYANRPVLFLEYDLGNPPRVRYSRFWAAYPDSSAGIPMSIVDSGSQWHTGYDRDLASIYREMVDHALSRPPAAEMASYWWRDGAQMRFYVRVKNLTGDTLSSWKNGATAHAIAYENTQVALTGRFVRDAVSTGLSELLPGETAEYMLESTGLEDVNWSRMAGAVILDYRPSTDSTAYDTAQAALATRIDTPFSANQKAVALMVDPADETMPAASIRFSGIPSLVWHVQEDAPWLEAKPKSGPLTTASVLSVDKEALAVSGGGKST
jgi:hypothetical protein